jgi:hypothetical protein
MIHWYGEATHLIRVSSEQQATVNVPNQYFCFHTDRLAWPYRIEEQLLHRGVNLVLATWILLSSCCCTAERNNEHRDQRQGLAFRASA